jgi:hypothetical protein
MGKGIPYPGLRTAILTNLINNLSGMVLPSMDDGNAGTSGHQTVDHFISRRLNSCESEDLHQKGEDQGDGLGLMDDRVIKGWIVHLH